MKNLIITILLGLISLLSFSYITMERFDDHYFPQISLEFVSDFDISEERLYVLENGKNTLPFTFTSQNYSLNRPLDIFIFIDETTEFEDNFEETHHELMDLYRIVKENGYDSKLRIITSSKSKNRAFFSGNQNLFSYDEASFEDLLNKVFNHQRNSVADFNLILESFSKLSYDKERQQVFIIISSGKEIGFIEDKRYLADRIIFKKSNTDIFVFSDNDSFYSKFYYQRLVNDAGGIVFDPVNSSISDFLDYYYGKNLKKNIITYVSKEDITPEDYFVKLFCDDIKVEYIINMTSRFYDNVRINSLIAIPFKTKPGEIIKLKCLSTPSDNVIYNWSSDSGVFKESLSTSEEIQWEAPSKAGVYTIKVTCVYKGSYDESETIVLVKE